MPTGGKHPDEDAVIAAQRELMEEVGYRANELLHINSYYTSKSVCRETAHLFIGRGLEKMAAAPDETEFLEVGILKFDAVLQMVRDSEIRDSMTVIAVLLAAQQHHAM
jgi:ADP-ribose pyrophosphatase